MATLNDLVSYTDTLLNVGAFKDYCPNGLQVEGRPQVHTLVSGVSASARLLDAALALKADAILVHHGYFWKGEDARIVGYKKQRLQRLLSADVSLIAYHLPLDAHPELGNNARLAQMLDINITGAFDTESGPKLGLMGALAQPRSGEEFAEHIERALGRTPLHVAGAAAQLKTIAWCSGGAQGYIDRAAALGVDAYLTGEVSEYTVHIARETGLHFFAAGHHATERYGVQALGAHLAQRFGLRHEYVEIDNPA
ncbi:MAG: Nif3-like dinuclear metal center hexameric protein [Gammaproteobacteria bacterium]|nr:Nif3-like dinuclear metal center hexameric protein [Gammaproteobacteria bacterium]